MTDAPEAVLKRMLGAWVPQPHQRSARAALEALVGQRDDALHIASDVSKRAHELEEKLRALGHTEPWGMGV